MRITSAEFIRGITGSDPILEDERPHIAFVGRSNVGKSSVINRLADRNNLAQSSGTPGKTQKLYFYLINSRFYLVDLPGYGYAKISAKRAEKIRTQMIWYLGRSERRPELVVLVIDAKAGMTDIDRDMLDIVAGEEYPLLVVVNKIDKLNQSETVQVVRDVESVLDEYKLSEVDVVPFSARTGQGREEALSILESYLG